MSPIPQVSAIINFKVSLEKGAKGIKKSEYGDANEGVSYHSS